MSERTLLMIPGSTIQDPSVLRAISQQSESHLSSEWAKKFKSVLDDLKKIFLTNGECFVFAGSGTLSQEAGLASFIERGDKVLCAVSNNCIFLVWAVGVLISFLLISFLANLDLYPDYAQA